MNYAEQNCTITGPQGQVVESGGAYVSPNVAIGYLCRRSQSDHTLVLKNWHGDREFGTATIISRWKIRGGYISGQMMQVEVTVDGVVYTGRSGGEGLIWKGRPRRKVRRV